jgi:Lrp/AsnC family transcriptional regulator for asnA, asnC and gidA
MLENQIDPIDLRIMKELTFDATISFVKLAKKLKVSNTLVHQRIKKLKDAGILKYATYHLDPWKLGYQTSAYTQIMLTDSKLHRQVEASLKEIPEIVECVNIVGRYALIVRIFAKNNQHLRNVIYEKVHTIEGIEGTNTTMCFETAFSRDVPLKLDW